MVLTGLWAQAERLDRQQVGKLAELPSSHAIHRLIFIIHADLHARSDQKISALRVRMFLVASD